MAARGSIFAAFDALGCGFDRDQATEYLSGSVTLQQLPDDVAIRVIGVCMAFAMTVVESDRVERDG